MEVCGELVWQAASNFVDSIVFMAVGGEILGILSKMNRVDFF
jgi:hypothetical protein